MAILTFWRGDHLNAPLHRLRRFRFPCRGGIDYPCRRQTPPAPRPAAPSDPLPLKGGRVATFLPSPPSGGEGPGERVLGRWGRCCVILAAYPFVLSDGFTLQRVDQGFVAAK